jgi:hypothetical protein
LRPDHLHDHCRTLIATQELLFYPLSLSNSQGNDRAAVFSIHLLLHSSAAASSGCAAGGRQSVKTLSNHLRLRTAIAGLQC